MVPLKSIGHNVKQFACEADWKGGNPEEIMADVDLRKVEVIPAMGATFELKADGEKWTLKGTSNADAEAWVQALRGLQSF